MDVLHFLKNYRHIIKRKNHHFAGLSLLLFELAELKVISANLQVFVVGQRRIDALWQGHGLSLQSAAAKPGKCEPKAKHKYVSIH